MLTTENVKRVKNTKFETFLNLAAVGIFYEVGLR